MLREALQDLGSDLVAAAAGIGGAAVAALRANGNAAERLLQFIVGFLCSLWFPLAAVKVFNLSPAPSMLGALGFVFGYFGIVLIDRVTDTLNTLKEVKWAEAVESWIKRR